MPLTYERVHELLTYDPHTGKFYRRVSRAHGRHAAGTEPGTVFRTVLPTETYYYRRIGIDGRYYLAHRLAYLWMTGEWPPVFIDHKDGDGLNNRWDNLRPATHGQNIANSKLRRNNRSGFKGIYPNGRKFSAHCGGRVLGTFNTREEAHAAYVRAARERWGEFARAA